MPRRLRVATGGLVYHVLNRAVGRARIFEKPEDYAAFERVLRASFDWLPMRLLAYCLLPNHWPLVDWLAAWPVPCPKGWLKYVNEAQSEAELAAVRESVRRGRPFGDVAWQRRTARRLGLESTLRPRGRPRKPQSQES